MGAIAPLPPALGDEMAAGAEVLIQPGDTLWELAEQYLGRGTEWQRLAAANPQLGDPTRLRVGSWMRLPGPVSEGVISAAASAAAGSVRVEQGDSLWKLAQVHFGSGAAWTCIAQASPQLQNPDFILPGQILALPASCAVA